MKYSCIKKPQRPGHPENGEMVIAAPQYEQKLTLDQFAREACGENTKARIALKSDIELIAATLRRLLRAGYKVDLEDLGEFSVKFKCNPTYITQSQSEDGNDVQPIEFSPKKQITDILPAWTPGLGLKSLLKPSSWVYDYPISWKQAMPRRIQARVLKAEIECQESVTLREDSELNS